MLYLNFDYVNHPHEVYGGTLLAQINSLVKVNIA
jgi:hypothetical protein